MSLPTTRTFILTTSLVVLAFIAGRVTGGGDSTLPAHPAAGTSVAPAEPTIWTCSMHPQVRLPEPGLCPMCSMDLVPASSGEGEDNLGPRTLQVSEAAMALADIETAPVERRTVAHEVNMVGKVAYDETRLAYITSWVAGRLDRLFVDYTGVTVRPGDHLVEIYSPTLYSAQQELLQAIATVKRLEGSGLDIVRSTSDRTVISSREKLRLYGLSEEQIQHIVERGVPDEHVTIRAPIGGVVVHKMALEGMYVKEGTQIYTIADLSKVWVVLDAYEVDLAWLRYGQDVEFRVEAYPGEAFHGRIAFIDPLLDDRTRTVKVRVNVDNSDGRLKPDMFVSSIAMAVLTEHGKVVDEDLAGKWMCPMHPEITADALADCSECGMDLAPASELGFVSEPTRGESLVIPVTAALVTGKRGVVYVRLPGYDKPTFEGREIALGPRAGDWYIVREGLEEGEQVVVKGNFKIDSELQIRAQPSMMSPVGGTLPPGHHHGDVHAGESMIPPPVVVSAPTAFKAQLGSVVEAYLRLQHELASDKDDGASARSMVEMLAAVDMGLLGDDGHVAWMEQLPELKRATEALAAAEDLEQRRSLLSPVTTRLIRALKTFGYERSDGAVGVFHCPMALGGDGADWIQQGEQTANPYFGSSMLRCGSLEELLKAGS
ncbi:MAG: Cu(I)/Ag(I) efflux system membrane fusion protein [Chlamydiales bacterium]|jgi:Cu(I)/Ag(I) efflux system membrane fusion protein